MNKIEVFAKEINYLKHDDIKENAKYLITELPEYFFEIPAASTGKYHPSYAQGKNGLVRHTKAAVRIAYDLLQDPCIGDKYNSREKDIMLVALMIHDGLKLGREQSKYTKVDHPILVSNMVKEVKDKLSFSDNEIELLTTSIASHMGPWNKDYDGNEILPVPKNKYQNFVHMCDYLASRKTLLVPFDQDNNIID